MQFVKDSVFAQKYPFESNVFEVRNYFQEYSELMYKCDGLENKPTKQSAKQRISREDDFYKEFMGINDEQLKELKEVTSEDNLTCEGEITPISFSSAEKASEFQMEYSLQELEKKPQRDHSLVSVQKKLESKAQSSGSEYTKDYLKYSTYQWCLSEKNTNHVNDLNPFKFDAVIVSVKIYHSFLSLKGSSVRPRMLQEIHILGNQYLSQLKDKIQCPMDYGGISDVSNDCFLKEVGLKMTPKDLYPSSFVFIENTFYNDTRSSKMKDLSQVIREWGEKRNLGPFSTRSMECETIDSIPLRLGRPYVYQHQGNCEHVLIFSDARFLNTTIDLPKTGCYPRVHAVGRTYGKHCMMCGTAYARWLVMRNKRLTHDKSYLCQKCFLSYNYVGKAKIGEFEAYEYADPVAIL